MATGDGSSCVPIDARLADLQEQIDTITAGQPGVYIKEEGSLINAAVFLTLNFVGALATATDAGGGQATITITGSAGSQNLYETIAVSASGGSASGGPCVAASTTDTITLVASNNIILTAANGGAGADTITIGVTGINVFDEIAVSGQPTVTATTVSEQLTLVAGSNMTITTNNTTKTITFASSGGGGGGGGTADWFLGTLDADLGASTASVAATVDEYGGTDPGATATVHNVSSTISTFSYIHVGTVGCRVLAIKNSSGNYRIMWVEPPVEVPVP